MKYKRQLSSHVEEVVCLTRKKDAERIDIAMAVVRKM